MTLTLDLPEHLAATDRALIAALAERNLADHGDGLLGLVLSGSAGRGLATDRSDLDVLVVLSDEAAAERTTAHSSEVDEIPWSRSELDTVGTFGTEDWWCRWSCAWAPVLLDRTDGALADAVRRQATLSPEEADGVLIDHDRLDGWLNFAYRALKGDRDGRSLETRLDAAESVPWLLDVVFAMAGRVRPYNKYLPWELRTHPLEGWPADDLLGLVERTLEGDVGAIRETFARVRPACSSYDASRGHTRTTDMVQGWGEELRLFEVRAG
ncbi:nucleotidyltransferase domain-containing protein [Nocardioides cavernae]|uniref:Nucleotidyltransferase domain-containing protein n=1 Tax=Nocardioides cavernae TaxID=1921566 RepID=A0ABR8ND54_9ACTN|nr:nucleotidyltransferase domain-containing protein [Nocardioides cavernae]MBD3926060.1 nucleotidyltransferase domain-containing protein [Nocardioides cavernae]MBM7513648.1 putative nucleotidyltransferase [Nocardioides cavernae]